jgi:hypothetical protein
MFEMEFFVVKYRLLPSVVLHAVVVFNQFNLLAEVQFIFTNIFSVRVLYCSGPKKQRMQQTADSRQQPRFTRLFCSSWWLLNFQGMQRIFWHSTALIRCCISTSPRRSVDVVAVPSRG